MTRTALVLALGVLALTAGCSALSGPQADSGPVTPATVPTVDAPLAPGVPAARDSSGQRDVDTAQLRAADARVRNTSAYRFTRTVTVEGDGVAVRIERDRETLPDGTAVGQFSASSTGDVTLSVVESSFWTDGEVYWTRTNLSDGPTIVSPRHPHPPSFHTLGLDLPGRLLGAAEYEVAREGDDEVVLRSTTPIRLTQPAVPVALEDSRNGTAWLTVRDDGLVVAVVFRYEATLGDRPVEVTIRQRVRAVDTAALEPPAWVTDA